MNGYTLAAAWLALVCLVMLLPSAVRRSRTTGRPLVVVLVLLAIGLEL